MHSSTSSSDPRAAPARLVNRGFWITLILLALSMEGLLRLIPTWSPVAFRVAYGNALSMYMGVANQLRDAAPGVEVLGLGDSLAMTQFQPDVLARELGISENRVFNAGYSGMSFPSQERMLRWIGLNRFEQLRVVLFFLNPIRVNPIYESNTDVLRVGIPDPDGPWGEVLEAHQVSPIFDYSRLYGLSRYLVRDSWRFTGEGIWDDVGLLGRWGGVQWNGFRSTDAPPAYPYDAMRSISAIRVQEMRSVIELLRSTGAVVLMIPSALHSEIDPFASALVRQEFLEEMRSIAEETGSVYLPDALVGFAVPSDTDFCDYGHMNRPGGVAFTEWLARHRGLREAAPWF